MKRLISFALGCAIVFCLMVSMEQRAYAYVDPGSCLFVFQGISSACLGVLYFIRRKLKMDKRKDAEAVIAEGEPS